MFDPRLYRTALLLVVLAIIAAAFSLERRPAPIRTQLAPDAFNALEASGTLRALADRFSSRRPGSAQDTALAREVARRFALIARDSTRTDRFEGDTIDGRRSLQNVSFSRPGAPGPGIFVVAHRDAAGDGARAELSATAILLELARVAGEGGIRRTITFVSTTGGSGGLAGARRLAGQIRDADPLAVLVVGDGASRAIRRPTVIGWSNGKGQAPIALQRTAQEAVRTQTGREPGAARAPGQWGRMAFPLTVGEQGAFNRERIASVMIQASGERGPAADAPTSDERLEDYGRAALSVIYALDQADADLGPPQAALVAQRKLVPYWAVRLLVGALLLVPLIVTIDGYARIRRRGERVGRWGAWAVSWALPFVVASLFVLLLGLVGIIGVTPAAPLPDVALGVGTGTGIGLAGVFVLLALTLLFVRPWVLRYLAPDTIVQRPANEGAAMAVMLTMTIAAMVAWLVNAYTAALLVPATHLWLVALSPQLRLRRITAAALVLVALAPPVALALVEASAFGWSAHQLGWAIVLLVAGGHASAPIWLLSSLICGCVLAALVVAVKLERLPRPGTGEAVPAPAGRPNVR